MHDHKKGFVCYELAHIPPFRAFRKCRVRRIEVSAALTDESGEDADGRHDDGGGGGGCRWWCEGEGGGREEGVRHVDCDWRLMTMLRDCVDGRRIEDRGIEVTVS